MTFSTTAAGGPPFTYLWRRDGTALTNQTNATLVLVNVQLTNAGTYSVEVTGCGRATNSAQLAVTPPVAVARNRSKFLLELEYPVKTTWVEAGDQCAAS